MSDAGRAALGPGDLLYATSIPGDTVQGKAVDHHEQKTSDDEQKVEEA